MLTANSEHLAELTEAQQPIIAEAAREVMETQLKVAKAADEANTAAWQALPRNYTMPDEAEMVAMKAAVREKVWPIMDGLIGTELTALVRANAE